MREMFSSNDCSNFISSLDNVLSSNVKLMYSFLEPTKSLVAYINTSLDHFCVRPVGTNCVFINKAKVRVFHKYLTVTFIGNEEDVILEPCVKGEKACMRRPQEVKNKCLSMYMCVLSGISGEEWL